MLPDASPFLCVEQSGVSLYNKTIRQGIADLPD